MKLWEKGYELDFKTEEFTTGKDKVIDFSLVKHDILGTLAHIRMLLKIEIINKAEHKKLHKELINIYQFFEKSNSDFKIETEDIHSQIELMLTKKLGSIGGKIHTGRSRNDQVLVDIHMFAREKLYEVSLNCDSLFNQLIDLSNKYRDIPMPGYTHLQVAMPSSFGLWFGAFAECLIDDLEVLKMSYKLCNQNPLGSAAGYGTSIKIDRQLTTELLGFDSLVVNSVKSQLGRSKIEEAIAFSLSCVANTLSKLSADICLFMGQNFSFLSFPDKLTTGSSIMPHKKNPDIFELIRARANKIKALQIQISFIAGNLTTGYFRDFQEIKGLLLPAFDELIDLLQMMSYSIEQVEINENILKDEKYRYIYSVENVNMLVEKGASFRDAYKTIAMKIKGGRFKPLKDVKHKHIGSKDLLCNNLLVDREKSIISQFNFRKIEKAFNNLLEI